MARSRTISPDFWTCEAVIDCAAMTRLLFIGLWNFADDFGVQPLRPRTIRMQVFPGDALDTDQVLRMIDELAARGLVRIYAVDGQEYVAVVDWQHLQRVGKRAKRRFPPDGDSERPPTDLRQSAPAVGAADEQPAAPAPTDIVVEAAHGAASPPEAPPPPEPPTAPAPRVEMRRQWLAAIDARLQRRWPYKAPLDADSPRRIDHWLDGGFDLADVLSAVDTLRKPPAGLHELLAQAQIIRGWRLAKKAA